MSRLVTASLDLDQFHDTDTTHPLTLNVWSYWYSNGYPVEDVVGAWTVIHEKPDSANTSHVVCEVETLEVPLSEADAAVDGTTEYACDCRDYQYNQGVELGERRLGEWGECKHIACVKEHNE